MGNQENESLPNQVLNTEAKNASIVAEKDESKEINSSKLEAAQKSSSKKEETNENNRIQEDEHRREESTESDNSETLQKIRELIRHKVQASTGGAIEEEYKKAQDEEFEKQFNEFKKSLQKNSKSVEEIYQQVVVDEINEEIYNNVEKSKGDLCVLVLDNERLLSFSKLWKGMNPLFYEARKGELHAKRSERLQNVSSS